ERVYELTTDVVGSGSIDVDPDQATYRNGDTIVLTAVPDPGWVFDSWSGDLSGSTNPETIVIAGSDVTVTATFIQETYTLTTNVNGGGSVTKTPDQSTYVYGDIVNVEAVPNTGWSFSSWSGGLGGTENPTTITITGNTTVTANFNEGAYELTTNVVGSGWIDVDPDQATYGNGDTIVLTAVPDPGWIFDSWSGDLSGSTNPETIVITGSDVTVTATFIQETYTLTVDPDGGGTVTKSPDKAQYLYGEQVVLLADPHPDSVFTGWSGALTGVENPATVVIVGNMEITAHFDIYVPSPPLPPQSVEVSEPAPGCVSVTWDANSEPDLSGYVVYYGPLSVDQGDAIEYLHAVDVGNMLSWNDCSFEQGTYYFAVKAYNDRNEYSSYSEEKRLDVLGPDTDPPIILARIPDQNEVNVDPAMEEIFFIVSDDHTGVDQSSITVLINGNAPASVTITPNLPDYMVTCTPAGGLPSDATVTVQVTASDLASPPNLMNESWSFTTTVAPPSIPTGLTAVGTDTGCVHVSWNPNPENDISGYTVYYGDQSVAMGQATEYENSQPVGPVTTYMIPALPDGTFYISLRAENEAGLMSDYAPEVSADVSNTVPPELFPPQNVQVSETTPGCVTVTWEANSEPDLAGYVVYYGPASVAQGQAGDYANSEDVANVTSHVVCGLLEGPQYFAVKAYDTENNFSEFSAEKRVDVVGPDSDPPVFSMLDPEEGEVGVPQDEVVSFVVSDDKTGVDQASISVLINGSSPGWINYTNTPSGYSVVCVPAGLLPGNTTITIEVAARDLASPPNQGNKTWSFTTGDSRPSVPTGLVAQGTNTGCAALSWDANSEDNITGYTIYWGTESVAGGEATEYPNSQDVGVVTGEELCGLMTGTNYFALRAKNDLDLYSDFSPEVSADVTNDVSGGPTAPQGVDVLETRPGCVTVSWLANPEPDIAGYKVYYGPVAGSPGDADSVDVGNVTSREICGFEQGIHYFMVRAYNTSGQYSDYSTEKRLTVVGPDEIPPRIVVGGPLPGAVDVPTTATVFFVLSDGQTGVDSSSLSVLINDTPPQKVVFVGDQSMYAAMCKPEGDLPEGSIVEVSLTVSDFATPPNTTVLRWEFTTEGGVPSSPTGFVAVGTNTGSVNLSWNSNPESHVAGYVIYYGASSVEQGQSAEYADIEYVSTTTSHTVTDLEDGTYYFTLTAITHSGLESAYAAEVSAHVTNDQDQHTQAPLPPQQVQVSETGPGCLTVAWEENSEPDIAGYVVYYGPLSVANGD
ncbi:MAG: fibronectin type III domain-containing protein, partial [Candidatus Latescibacterota bacterium]